MTSEKYEENFAEQVEELSLRASVRNLLNHMDERQLERLFYTALADGLKDVRFSACSSCWEPLQQDDWDLQGNATDTCNLCRDEEWKQRLSTFHTPLMYK